MKSLVIVTCLNLFLIFSKFFPKNFRFHLHYNQFFTKCLYKIIILWYNIVNTFSFSGEGRMEFILKNFKEELIVEQLANIHYFEFTPSYHTAGDRHEFCELLYVDRGSIRIVSDHYTGDLCKNQLILHGANQRHALVCDENIAPNIIIIGFECKSEHIEKLTYSPLLLSEEL